MKSLVCFVVFFGFHYLVCPDEFSCVGRVAGYYADVASDCAQYHVCAGGARQYSYHCPNTTRFLQRLMICEHAHLVDCRDSENHFSANLLLGQRGLPFVSEPNSPIFRQPVYPSNKKPRQVPATSTLKPFTNYSPFFTTSPKNVHNFPPNTQPKPFTKDNFLPKTSITPRTTQETITRAVFISPTQNTLSALDKASIKPLVGPQLSLRDLFEKLHRGSFDNEKQPSEVKFDSRGEGDFSEAAVSSNPGNDGNVGRVSEATVFGNLSRFEDVVRLSEARLPGSPGRFGDVKATEDEVIKNRDGFEDRRRSSKGEVTRILKDVKITSEVLVNNGGFEDRKQSSKGEESVKKTSEVLVNRGGFEDRKQSNKGEVTKILEGGKKTSEVSVNSGGFEGGKQSDEADFEDGSSKGRGIKLYWTLPDVRAMFYIPDKQEDSVAPNIKKFSVLIPESQMVFKEKQSAKCSFGCELNVDNCNPCITIK